MIIYLKYDKHVEFVEDISLKDGFIPVIGDSLPILPGSSEPLQLDPSLWYKTLVVNAVYIDCDDREVRWTRSVDSDSTHTQYSYAEGFFPKHAQQLHDINVYEFDPTKDEFLDRANDVMEHYIAQTITKEHFKIDVIRLLHCYILPLLQFDQMDGPAIENVLSYVETRHEKMELTLLKKTEELQRTENVLQKQRERILLNEQFDSDKYVWSCNRVFLTVYLSHIEKDINNVNLELDQLSEHITNLKKSAKENASQTCEEDLVQHRETRDKVLDWLVKLQIVRETIKNVIYRPVKTKKNKYRKIKIKENVIHNIYQELDNRIRQQKDDIQSLIMKKVRLSSVREAVYGILCALRRNKGATSPIETADGSEYSLDIIGLQSKPADWDTLEEKVSRQLEDLTSDVHAEHSLGCQRICDLVQACFTETTMFGLQTADGDWELVTTAPGCVCSEFTVSTSRPSLQQCTGLDNLSAINVNLALVNIKESFKTHMDKVSDMLMKSIPHCTHHQHKIWMLYENIFSPECLPKLLTLYKLSVQSTCQTVYKMVSALSVRDIMNDDQRFLKLLRIPVHGETRSTASHENLPPADPPGPCEADSRPVSNVSLVSFEIKKCTLEELYSMADKDCSVLDRRFAVESEDKVDVVDDVVVSPSSSSTNLTSSSEETDAEDELTDTCNLEDMSLAEVDYKTKLSDMFASTKNLLHTFLKAKTVMDKFRMLTRVYRDVGQIISTLMGDKGMVCCDEMLSMMIVLLWCLDMDTFLDVYTNIKLLIDLMPDFLNGHVHDCSLTNFSAAYQMLFDTECLHRKTVCRQ
ncbi:uncharacterized protein LOC121383602 [Gigantopelta aegis]|uniref:uncharacterized protein LOC121383602 n=1 Tax=Gigantopelta aegis TaxID=1735272 RepID=UPI001B888138|nr:uncharacterized protein LOC121383602 [Gigantopelta aegis]